jgi:outer membrane protein assembly factor BamA
MSADTLKRHFLLKPGESFSDDYYQHAQDELHKLRVFKKLDFSAQPNGDRMNIHIRAEDGWYIFPMAFFTGGSKSAGGLSLAAGNLFKQGESTFLFAGGSRDGWTTHVGWVTPKHFFNLRYTHLDADQRFYQRHWMNIPSVFSTADDKENHGDKLLREISGTEQQIEFVYKYRLSRTWRLALRPQYKYVSYQNDALDGGKHHQVNFGLEFSDDIRPGMNMGALSGYGLTDKKKSLQNLPQIRNGYTGSLAYTGGGDWTGSDYDVSKLSLKAAWFLELKTRHVFMLQLHSENAFDAPFSDQITSTDLFSGMGRYDRQLRGKRGAGLSTSFIYYLMRNDTGLLSVAPFYELAYVDTGNAYTPHSGAGATLMYKLWRFPLPFGLNYTHNLQDGSHQVGFVIGGAF